jgi:hypothetical protein
MTFYSFKGGTGRSMALANVATLIAQRNGGKNVLAIDWDLEAPGLHRYFRPYVRTASGNDRDEELENAPGLIEFLLATQSKASAFEKVLSRDEVLHYVFLPMNISDYFVHTDIPKLKLLKAGAFNVSYSARINTFDWKGLYTSQPFFFAGLADYLSLNFDFALIDSRTGFTDISGICTSLLPDALVAVFTPNLQSLSGVLDVVKQAVGYRSQSDDLRPLKVFPLVSRVELSELKLNEAWRFGDPNEDIRGYQPEFERLFEDLYGISSCDLTAYFDQAQVQYVPFYSFGEKIAARSGEATTFSLARSYETFTDIVQSAAPSWDLKARENGVGRSASEPIPWNAEWFEDNKRRALVGIEKAGQPATMEVRFSLSRVKLTSSRASLLDAAKGAGLNFGWPIGVVLDNRDQYRPKPSPDGIYSEIFDPDTQHYWALRTDGDFFALRSLSEDDEGARDRIFFDTRIVQIIETLLFCERLYGKLEVAPRSEVRVVIEHAGLKDRQLKSSQLRILRSRRPSEVDRTTASIEVVIGRIESDLVELVKKIASPLFELFDFASFPDSVYQGLVDQVISKQLK